MERLHIHNVFEVSTSARRNGDKPDNFLELKTQESPLILKKHSPFNIREWVRGLWDFGLEGASAAIEFGELLNDPVWQGEGVPKGHGETVIPIPGLLIGAYPVFLPMEVWLRRMDYEIHHLQSTFLSNNGPIEALEEDLIRTCQQEAEKSGKKVNVIGHSKGGYIGLAALKYHPTECSQYVKNMVVMGAPTNPPIELNPLIDSWYRFSVRIGGLIRRGTSDFELMRRLNGDFTVKVPKGVQLIRIESQRDGIIRGTGSDYSGNGRYIINRSHLGMVVNSQVYKIIADRFCRK